MNEDRNILEEPLAEYLKVDRTKCYSIKDYALKIGVARQTVYNRIADKSLKIITIGGKPFVYDV